MQNNHHKHNTQYNTKTLSIKTDKYVHKQSTQYTIQTANKQVKPTRQQINLVEIKPDQQHNPPRKQTQQQYKNQSSTIDRFPGHRESTKSTDNQHNRY